MNYYYPIETFWTKEEIIDVVNFFNLIEQAYEKSVNREDILLAYTRFKQIVPAKNEEKKYFKQFTKASNYVPYQVVKLARQSNDKKIKMRR